VNIELLTLSEIKEVNGSQGNFTVSVVQHPRYVDVDKCIACGLCAEKCPKKVADEYNEGLAQRKAIYVPYSQAVPLKYTIDGKNCIYLEKGKCGACEKFCPSGAINFHDAERTLTLQVGSIILAPGYKAFDPSRFDNYAWANLADVVTALEFERVLSATGPYSGHLVRPSSKRLKNQPGTHPQKIAWLQCVGSRDLNRCDNEYCSSVCCMYAVKQAVMAKDHSPTPLECTIFYMDMRTPGKDFDRYYENARAQGVRFVPSRIHTIASVPASDDLMLRYVDEKGNVNEEIFDMVVLSTGLEISRSTADLAIRLGIKLDRYHFTFCDSFHPVATSIPGIYACGAFTGPKDIPQSVMEASAAACAATEKLAPVRNTCTRAVAIPPEWDVSRAPPRIGVFVCNCGINIGGIVRVPEVVEYAKTLPGVVYVEENLFTCSQDTQVKISQVIREKGLNRVVIAACTPRTHEALFQETLVNAGLNKYLVEMANIRNQDSWVHSDNPDVATQKAKDLVRMAVAKVTFSRPLQEKGLPVTQSALIVGGGVAGMTAALSIARQGYPVHLVEKSNQLGGNARHLNKTYRGENIKRYLENLITAVQSDKRITVYQETTVNKVDGFVGNFTSALTNGQTSHTVEHGVALLASGARESQPKEYLYGQHKAVVTHLELDAMLRDSDPRLKQSEAVVFIQCVGSRNEQRPYCSRVCCTHSLKTALELKERDPDINVYILYRDIRTYGQREELYKRARERGFLFFRYDPDNPPAVSAAGEQVVVTFEDSIIGSRLSVSADILCLASAIESYHDHTLAQNFKVSMDNDGWLLEAHQKLRPVEFANEGIFLCGMAHYPKPIEESIAQAQAAASRAMTVLARESIMVGGIVAHIEPELCSGCLGCINVCPFAAITFNHEKKTAEVNPALCKGCGACAAACPSEAPILMGFSNKQMYAQIKSVVNM
jgi:heterodisulfide reductase subunit A